VYIYLIRSSFLISGGLASFISSPNLIWNLFSMRFLPYSYATKASANLSSPYESMASDVWSLSMLIICLGAWLYWKALKWLRLSFSLDTIYSSLCNLIIFIKSRLPLTLLWAFLYKFISLPVLVFFLQHTPNRIIRKYYTIIFEYIFHTLVLFNNISLWNFTSSFSYEFKNPTS